MLVLSSSKPSEIFETASDCDAKHTKWFCGFDTRLLQHIWYAKFCCASYLYKWVFADITSMLTIQIVLLNTSQGDNAKHQIVLLNIW